MCSSFTTTSVQLSLSDHHHIRNACSQEGQHRRSIFAWYWSKEDDRKSITSESSSPFSPRKRVVTFNPSVSVLEYHLTDDTYADDNTVEQTSCTKESGLKIAQLNVLSLLKEKCYLINPRLYRFINIANFSSPALRITRDDQIVVGGSQEFQSLLETNITRALIVESNEKFLQLYARCMNEILPHVTIFTATNAQHALDVFKQNLSSGDPFPFDLVLVNHRLCGGGEDMHEYNSNNNFSSSGSDILSNIQQMEIDNKYQPLLIGTSVKLKEDSCKLVRSGADFLWGVPPPPVNAKLRNEILMALLNKRAGGQSDVVFL